MSKFKVGDRVVRVRNIIDLPSDDKGPQIGAIGTIIEVGKTFVDVRFDIPFLAYGTTPIQEWGCDRDTLELCDTSPSSPIENDSKPDIMDVTRNFCR